MIRPLQNLLKKTKRIQSLFIPVRFSAQYWNPYAIIKDVECYGLPDSN